MAAQSKNGNPSVSTFFFFHTRFHHVVDASELALYAVVVDGYDDYGLCWAAPPTKSFIILISIAPRAHPRRCHGTLTKTAPLRRTRMGTRTTMLRTMRSTTGGRSSKPRGRRTAAWAACPRRPSKPPRPVRVPCGRRFGTVAVAVGVYLVDLRLPQYDRTAAAPDNQQSAAAAAAAQSVVRRSAGRRVWRGARGAAVLVLSRAVARKFSCGTPKCCRPSRGCSTRASPEASLRATHHQDAATCNHHSRKKKETAPFYDDFADFGGPIGGDDALCCDYDDTAESKASNTKKADENSPH